MALISSHPVFRLLSIMINLVILAFSFLLLFLQWWGIVLGIILVGMGFLFSLFVFRSRIGIADGTLIYRGLLFTTAIPIAEISSISNVRVIGTVSNSILGIRSFVVNSGGRRTTITSFQFPYQSIVGIISKIETSRS